MIFKQLIVGAMGVCCYVVGCEKTGKGMIIDPGGDEGTILTACEGEGLTVDYIVNTHGHPDHVCGNGIIKQKTGAGIIMHEADADFFARPEVESYFAMLGLAATPPPDTLVRDGDTITVGELSFTVIHTPGHTPGGMCLYRPPDLFTGDTLFAGGVGRTDFPGGSTRELLHSIRERLLNLPHETVVWPGHGYGGVHSTIGDEMRSNPFLNGEW